MFFVHAGVYAANGVDATGVLNDWIKEGYERARPDRHDPRYQHILDEQHFSLKHLFTKIADRYERCAINVRQDLLYNLTTLQMAQSRIISPYLGETEGFIQPLILSGAVDLAMELTDELHQWQLKDWLPSALLKSMEKFSLEIGGQVTRDEFYFDI